MSAMNEQLLSREECRKYQINILKYIVKVCQENGLHYYLAYGTLLGAIRHHGFIPWDDDIDIYMARNEYSRLLEILHESRGNISIIDDSTAGYYYPFAKAVDITTMAKMEDNLTQHGIWIDIFPIDNLPENEVLCRKFLKKSNFWRAVVISMTTDFSAHNLGKKALPKVILNLLALLYGKQKVIRKYKEHIMKYQNTSTEFCGCMSSAYISRERFEKKYLFSEVEVDFENEKFACTKYYDYYLKRLYGEYLALPPEDKRKVHSITAWKIDKNNSN